MKKILLTLLIAISSTLSFAQQKLISYEDLRYLLHSNSTRADTFMLAKGYTIQPAKPNQKIKKYDLKLPGNTQNEVTFRYDGKKLFISLQTNAIEQYNLLLNSIAQYKITAANLAPDVDSYQIKDLANIYITINESVPFDALKKDYDIQIVPEKGVVAIN